MRSLDQMLHSAGVPTSDASATPEDASRPEDTSRSPGAPAAPSLPRREPVGLAEWMGPMPAELEEAMRTDPGSIVVHTPYLPLVLDPTFGDEPYGKTTPPSTPEPPAVAPPAPRPRRPAR